MTGGQTGRPDRLATVRRLAPLAPLAVLLLLLTGCSVGVPNGSVVSATPSEVVGKPPKAPTVEADPAAGKVVFTTVGCSACHTFTPAGSSSNVGPDLDNLAEYAKAANQGTLAEFVKDSILDPERLHRARLPAGRDAAELRAVAEAAADRRSRRVPDAGHLNLRLPEEFPREVEVVATDLDRTLIWEDGALRERTLAALRRARPRRACA